MSLEAAARRRALAVLWIALANLLGGVSYPAQKAALEGLPPATVTWIRNGTAALALLLWVRVRGRSGGPWTRADARRALVLGALAFALPMWLGIVGVRQAGASSASILILLEPITIVAIAWLFLKERIGRLKFLSLVLGLLGALAIVLEGAEVGSLLAGERFRGNLVLVLHGVLWGCYTPIAKPLSERRDPFDLCLRVMLVATVALTVPALLEIPQWQAETQLAPALAWSVALGLFVSFGSTVLWLAALRDIPATSVAGFVFLQPLAGVLVGAGLLGEQLSPALLLGGALIVVGVAIDAAVSAFARPRKKDAAPEGP